MASPTPVAANPENSQASGAMNAHAGMPPATGSQVSAKNPGKPVRRLAPLLCFGLLLGLLALFSLAVGSKHIELSVVIEALLQPNDSADHAIIRDSRLPRAILGVLAGSALGIAGALVQSMTRNALAEPGILGVNAGASLAIVIAVGTFGVNGFNSYVWLD